MFRNVTFKNLQKQNTAAPKPAKQAQQKLASSALASALPGLAQRQSAKAQGNDATGIKRNILSKLSQPFIVRVLLQLLELGVCICTQLTETAISVKINHAP